MDYCGDGLIVGFVICILIIVSRHILRENRKRVNARMIWLESIVPEWDVLRKSFVIFEHELYDAKLKFATMDGGLNWYEVNVSTAGVLVRTRIDPQLEADLISQLCEKFAKQVGEKNFQQQIS